MDQLGDDERAVTETAGVAILVGITILVTATVGLNVLVVSEQGPEGPHANFSYDHVDSSGALVITHVKGDEFPAGELVIAGENAETTWAAAASVNETEPIGPGDIVQISQDNSYGKPVRKTSTVRIFHDDGGNRTQLSEWS